jgi:hypothetical protein
LTTSHCQICHLFVMGQAHVSSEEVSGYSQSNMVISQMSTSSQGSWNKNSELPVLAILPSITSRYLLLKFDHFLIGFGIDRFFLFPPSQDQ